MIVSGFLGFFIALFSGHFWRMNLNIFVFFLGIMSTSVEIQCELCKMFIRRTVETQIGMLKQVDGRGWFYVFCSTICLCQWQMSQILNMIAGFWVLSVGILCIFVGYFMNRSLNKFKDVVQEKDINGNILAGAALRQRIAVEFDEADTDGDGFLDKDEVKHMVASKITDGDGDLGYGELDSIFAILDTDDDGRVDLKEFTAWFVQDEPCMPRDVEANGNSGTHDNQESNLNELSKTKFQAMEAFDVFKWIYTIGGVGLLIAAVMGLMDAFSNLDRDTVFAELVASLLPREPMSCASKQMFELLDPSLLFRKPWGLILLKQLPVLL